MATYLQLCKDTARESGTVTTLDTPSTTSGQTGRLQRIVYWVRDAYADIQQHHAEWRWLEADFSGETIAGVRDYNSAAMSIADRFSRWVHNVEDRDSSFSIYKTSTGRADEHLIPFIPWERFRRTYDVGSAALDTGKPCYVTIKPDNSLAFYPTPDAAYTVRGRYRKSPQRLASDGEIPEMPEEFHDLIKWRALILLGTYDEAVSQVPLWGNEARKLMGNLETSQLPQIRLAGPLA